MKYILLLISIVFVGVLFLNINNNTEKPETNIFWDNARNYQYVPQANKGTSVGLVNNTYDVLVENTNFKLKKTEDLKNTIAIVNQNKKKEDYLIIPLVNYEQKDILLGDIKRDKIKVEVDPSQIVFIPFSITDLEEGFHDFAFLIVPDSTNKELSEDYRISTTGSDVMSIRGTINISSDNNNSKHSYKLLNNYSIREELPSFDGIFLTQGNSLKPWLVESINKEKKHNIKFNINIGNTQRTEKKFILVSFLNWEQISINEENKVFYGKIPGQSYATIEGEIKKDNSTIKDILNYITVFIPHPYEEVDSFNPDYFINSSGRVGLDNREF